MPHQETLQERKLLAPELAQCIIVEADSRSLGYLANYVRAAYSDLASLHLVRGAQCRSVNGLFNEWAAALQFPFYFGGNWAAFTDCLRDLPRGDERHHVVLIANAGQLLGEDDSCLPDFFAILSRVPADWKRMYPQLEGLQLKLILHATEQDSEVLKARLHDLGQDFDEVTGDWLDLLAEQ